MNPERQSAGKPPAEQFELREVPIKKEQEEASYPKTVSKEEPVDLVFHQEGIIKKLAEENNLAQQGKKEGNAMQIENIVFQYRNDLFYAAHDKTLYDLIPENLARALENEKNLRERLEKLKSEKPKKSFPFFREENQKLTRASIERALETATALVDTLTAHYTPSPDKLFFPEKTQKKARITPNPQPEHEKDDTFIEKLAAEQDLAQQGNAMQIENIVFQYRRGLFRPAYDKTLYDLIPENLARALENEKDLRERLEKLKSEKPKKFFSFLYKKNQTLTRASIERALETATARVEKLIAHFTTTTSSDKPLFPEETQKKLVPIIERRKKASIKLYQNSKDEEIKTLALRNLPDKKLRQELEASHRHEVERYEKIVTQIRVTDNHRERDYLLRRMPYLLERALRIELTARDRWEAETAPPSLFKRVVNFFKKTPQPHLSGQNLENRFRAAQNYTNEIMDGYTSPKDGNENVILPSLFQQRNQGQNKKTA